MRESPGYTGWALPRDRFVRWVLLAVIIWSAGITALLGLVVLGPLRSDLGVRISQIWTEVVGFGFAGGALYLAWQQAQEPTLSLSFEPDSDVGIRANP